MTRRFLLVAAMLVAALPLHAAAQASPDEATVRTGRVGLEEREALDAKRGRYNNLRLALAETNGAHLADTDVRLSTADGQEIYSGTSR